MIWGLRSSRTVVVAVAIAAFVVLCVLPVAYMFGLALADVERIVTAEWVDSRQRGLLSNTVLLGVGTAALATSVGAPLGFVLARVSLPFKPLFRLGLAAPAVLPTYVVGLAWIYLGGTAGLVSRATGAAGPIPGTYSVLGAVIVLGIVFYPLSMLATEVGLRRLEPRLEEAALLVATPARVLSRITLPLVAPTVLAAALVVFVLAISEFAVPGLLRVRVFTTEVFTAFAALYDFGRATALALPLLIVSIGVAVIAATRVRGRHVARRRVLSGSPAVGYEMWRLPACGAVICILTIAIVVPLTVLAAEASRVASMADMLRGAGEAVVNSLVLAAVGATVVTILAAPLALARARTNETVAAFVDVTWLVLFTVPSTVVGIGLIGIWNRPTVFGALYGTPAMVVLGYLARFVPVAALLLAASVRTVPLSQEEAAAAAGVGWWRTVTRIILPQIRIALVAAWVVVFVMAFGEIGTSILVAPPGEATLPIRVYTLIANAPPGYVAALALFQAIVIFCPLILVGVLAGFRDAA
jgi:iron(III) transport system permease protein